MPKKIKEEKKKIIKKKVETKKKVEKKKEVSFFIVLLKKSDLLFASWKIDAPIWRKRIETAEKDPVKKPYLFIDLLSVEDGKYNKIDSIPVHGLENNWHIFVKKEYCGRRMILNLSYRNTNNKYFDILKSREIDIPLALDDMTSGQLNEDNILLELSEIKQAGISGTENSSW